jgi:hypothetical protein
MIKEHGGVRSTTTGATRYDAMQASRSRCRWPPLNLVCHCHAVRGHGRGRGLWMPRMPYSGMPDAPFCCDERRVYA